MSEVKISASTPFLVCFAIAIGATCAVPASGSEMGRLHESAVRRMYADQDAEAALSRTLAEQAAALINQNKYAEACEKYSEAIKGLKENVIDQLLTEAANIDSWRSRQRLEEFTADLKRYQLGFGNLKLKMAEDALLAGQFDNAVALASDAILIDETLRDRAMQLQVTARGRKNAAGRRDNTAVEVSDPGVSEREADIKLLIAQAQNYYRAG